MSKGQHTCIPIVLQGAFADIKQLAHIAVVQPIGMLALFPKCLVAGLGKTEYLIPQPRPI
ncbi:multidrug DMT transporter permease [Prevotella intermedia ZT]|uniref:Multidrug DMT transporter permease n=1 Tax=Prevotella intermedia ZT TaxID=1347790 RepID=A0AAP0V7V5_PREIN|nr:multidrug DMT transporter permease [Prevotella intermedia ZT]